MDKHSTDKELNKTQTFIRGSDPRTATCRGKLQSQRCKLNQEINKELRLRAGAENLYKATTNRKLKDTVAIELSFVNSNLQLLKEKLSELNSSVEIYQNDSRDPIIPMIPLGLKETKEVNLIQPLSDFIQEHYSEDATLYVDPIADLMDTRQAARTPTRDLQGVALLFRYFNLLYFVERRFFSPDRNLGIYFEWYDSLTGVPSSQRTIAFEKAGILFNLGAIYTQIGARQDRNSEKGLDSAVNNFLRAAGIFKHIAETFTNAPSIDLKPQVLEILVSIMLIQARECLYEKLNLQIDHLTLNDLNHLHHDLSGEAAQLMREYNDMHNDIQSNGVLNFIPECWVSLIPLKAEYYKALSHYHAAKSINEKLKSNVNEKNGKSKRETFIYEEDEYTLNSNVNPIAVKKAHIKESIASLEETQRLQRMSRDLKGKVSLTAILQNTYLRAQEEKDILDEEHENIVVDDYDLIDIKVEVSSKFTLSLTSPDFTTFKVDDPFKRLGPIAIFSARRHWTSPRSIRLHKGNNIGNNNNRRSTTNGYCKCKTSTGFTHTGQCEICMKYDTYGSHEGSNDSKSDETIEGFGFNIRGDAPVIISHVEYNSLAFLGGMKEGDFIVEVMGIDVKWYTNDQVLKLIHNASSTVELKLITPINRNYLKPIPMSSKSTVSTLSGNSSSGISSGRTSPIYNTSPSKVKAKKSGNLTSGVWNPFRRTQSMGKIF